jgi:ATP-binding cassette subfamily B protein
VAGLAAASLFGLLVPWTIRDAVDSIAGGGGTEALLLPLSKLLLFALLHALLRYASRRGLLSAARLVEKELREALFSRLLRLPLSFHGAGPTGDLHSRVTNDVTALWLLLGPGVLTLAGTAVTWVMAVFFMGRVSPLLTAAALAAAPAVILLSRRFGGRLQRLHRRTQETLGAMGSAVQENVSGIRVVKAYGLEERETERFRGRCRDHYLRSMEAARASSAFHGLLFLLAGTGAAAILVLGGLLVAKGALTLGGFVAFNAYLAMLSFPTMALGWVLNLVQRGAAAMGRIAPILEAEPEGEGEAGALPPGGGGDLPGAPLLEVRGLTWSYDRAGRGEALSGVAFRLERGEAVGIAGGTGGGKSTLLSIVASLREAPPGTLFLGGRDASSLPLAERRGRTALVPQEPLLFSDTILANVCYSLPSPDRERAAAALAAARLDGEVGAMPAGIDTLVGERGVSLSGGQRQRLALARALLAPGELLLLDDALSAVDADAEDAILSSLLDGRGDRAVLFASHRMAPLSRCDRVVVLDGGRIVEQGSPAALLAAGGRYRELWEASRARGELEAME